MDTLLSVVTVTITVKGLLEQGGEYSITVPRALVCKLSEHFSRTFKDGAFVEGENRAAMLEDVEPWVLQVFGEWLLTQKLAYPEEKEQSTSFADMLGETSAEQHQQENLPADPITWSWEALFAVYQFADQYSTRRLRQSVFEAIQTKTLQILPRIYHLPRPDAIAFVANNLPESSPLRRFLIQVFVHANTSRFHTYGADLAELSSEELQLLPHDFLADSWKALQRHSAAKNCGYCSVGRTGRRRRDVCTGVHGHVREEVYTPRYLEWCTLHEHESDLERDECEKMGYRIEWRFQEDGGARLGDKDLEDHEVEFVGETEDLNE